ncbi:MAG: thiamine pyrophosphate-binding protein [Bacillota bacterium]
MPTLTGGQAVVETLLRNDVNTVFGIPGVHTLHIYDALVDRPQIRRILNRHEQGSGFMADGYGRASGRPGVAIIITGPGLTNMATPLGQAYSDSSPVVVVSSEIESAHIGKGRGVLHELKDQLAFMGQLTRWNAHAKRVEDIPGLLQHALTCHVSGRPGPVHVQVPHDLLGARAEFHLVKEDPQPPAPDPALVEKAAGLLLGCKSPIIYAGGGAQGAALELRELAERLGAPVLTTCLGKGAFPDDHCLALGNNGTAPEVRNLLEECDLMLAVGTRFGPSSTANWSMPVPRLIHIDIDREELGRNYPAELKICADARLTLEGINAHLRHRATRPVPRGLTDVQAKLSASQQRQKWQWGILSAIRDALGRDGILVPDMTVLGYTATRAFPVFAPRSFLFPRGFGTLGFAPPAAAGAKLARPGQRVIALCGDGGFLFTAEELAVAVQHHIAITVVLINSHSYEVVRRNQERQFGRYVDVDLVNPNFQQLTEAFGAVALAASDGDSLAAALAETAGVCGPVVIEVPFEKEE